MSQTSADRTTHRNDERTVRCPATYSDGTECGDEKLARGLHLHVLRKNDDAHGPQGEIPVELNLDEAETVGTKSVDLDYPDERASEDVARQCPYCGVPFRGKQGLAIHFGQVVGRKNHPKDREEFPDPTDCPVVHVDDKENIVEVVENDATMPSTSQRNDESVTEFITRLRAQGHDGRADAVENALSLLSD